MIPRTLTLAVSQLNLVVMTAIASGLAVGSLTIFNLANNLQYFPIGIFGVSFAIAVFPALSAAAFDNKKMVVNFSSAMRQILFFIVPSTVLLLVLRVQIVRVILGSGNFSWEDTILTFNTLGYFSIGLFAQAAIPLLIRVFYARSDSRTPFVIGLLSVIVNVFLAFYFSAQLGVGGLALAFSISGIFNFALLWLLLHFTLGDMDESRIFISVCKFSAAALACGYVAQQMKGIVWPFIDMTKLWGVLAQGAVAGLLGIVAYALVCWLLRSEEMAVFAGSLKARLLRMMAKNRPTVISEP
jgi:putative peptidoglycan lipid II flippase